MGFSLFEESKRTHKHVECKEDFFRELYELFEIARKQFLQEVVVNRMNPKCFIDLFERSYHYVDCDLSLCKNARLMILGIIKEVFTDKTAQVVIASKSNFSQQNVIDLYVKHVMLDASYIQENEQFLTFGCNLSKKQMDLLVNIVQTHDIFRFPEDGNVRGVLIDFFNCVPHVFIDVRNVRNIATLLDAMAQCRLINNNWQHVVEKGKFLKRTIKGKPDKYITATCLSSSLSRTRQRNTMTASQYAIRNAVAQMLKDE